MKPLFLSSRASFLSVRRHKLMFADYIHRREEFFTARHLPFDSVVIYKAGGSVSFEAVRFLKQHRVPIIQHGGVAVACLGNDAYIHLIISPMVVARMEQAGKTRQTPLRWRTPR